MRAWVQRMFAAWVLVGVLLAGNLHLPVVQVVAWVRMYQHYRQGYAPAKALEVVFSGNVPCKLCKFVRDAQKEQQVLAGSLAGTFKVLLPLDAAETMVFAPPGATWPAPAPAREPASWIAGPETPPPRTAGGYC